MSHEIAKNWRLKAQRYSLSGEKCGEGHFIFPPHGGICPGCVRGEQVVYEAPIEIGYELKPVLTTEASTSSR